MKQRRQKSPAFQLSFVSYLPVLFEENFFLPAAEPIGLFPLHEFESSKTPTIKKNINQTDILKAQTISTEDTKLLTFKNNYAHILSLEEASLIFINETDNLVYYLFVDLVFKGVKAPQKKQSLRFS